MDNEGAITVLQVKLDMAVKKTGQQSRQSHSAHSGVIDLDDFAYLSQITKNKSYIYCKPALQRPVCKLGSGQKAHACICHVFVIPGGGDSGGLGAGGC
eukprot:6174674-Pleurochrysis_carterae.AAC.3